MRPRFGAAGRLGVNASSSAAAAAAAPAQIAIPPSDVAPPAAQTGGFDGAKAYDQVAKLVAFGPHPPATDAIHAVQNYIHSQLQGFGCAVDDDDFNAQTGIGNLAMKNIVAKIPGTGQGIILLLTHYDTKRVDNFVGAEDGGSSTGLMLEMARVLCGRPKQAERRLDRLSRRRRDAGAVRVVGDGQRLRQPRAGRAPGASRATLKRVRAVILADMVGQTESALSCGNRMLTKWLTDLIWHTAATLGYKRRFRVAVKFR